MLINAQLLAEGWNSPRATVVHAPRADRVEARLPAADRPDHAHRTRARRPGIVVDFVPKGATHNERVVSLHSLLDADFYREGARVTPAPRRRVGAPRAPEADAGAVARPGHAGRRAAGSR